jgi:Mn2+/Fe2+ NRAMP family transporter
LAFLVVAWKANPNGAEILAEVQHLSLTDSGYLYLLAANLGTSVMPWTVFYQQSALIGKGLTREHIKLARLDTLFGAILCQLITAAVLIAAAATLGRGEQGSSLDSVPEIANAFTAVLGGKIGRVIFALGLSGGALVATIVVCLTSAWAIGEIAGVRHSLERHPFEAPWFYFAFAVTLIGGGLLVASGINLVHLSIATGVINALLLPVILGFLYLLAQRALPDPYRLKGLYAKVVALLFLTTAGFGLYAGIFGILGG